MSDTETIYDATTEASDDLSEEMPATALAPLRPSQQPAQTFDRAKLDLIKRTVAAGTSDDEFALFVEVCNLTGLNPFTRQIYAIMRRQNEGGQWINKMTIQTGIDGYRLMAERSGQLAGIDDVAYDTETGEHPTWARVTVYRFVQGQRVAFTATARWREYASLNKDGNPTAMWARMPWLMLGKCAEALALRKAFPYELSGVYTAEEMAQADNPLPTPPVERRQPAPQPRQQPASRAQAAEHRAPQQRQPTPAQRDAGRPADGLAAEGDTTHPAKEPAKDAPATDQQAKVIAKLAADLRRPAPVYHTYTEASRLIQHLNTDVKAAQAAAANDYNLQDPAFAGKGA